MAIRPEFACFPALLILSAGLIPLSGCGGPAAEPTPTTVAEPEAETTTQTATQPEEEPEAETASAALPQARMYEGGEHGATRTSSPAEVCRAFVNSLHERNIVSAERLLTLSSRLTLHDQGLELDAIASENAQYVIGDAKYATQLKQLAYVDCHVTEPTPEGEVSFVVSWMLKPEAGYGWRVFGMVMKESGRNHLINFELAEHAEVVSDLYTAEQSPQGPEVRQASAGNGDNR